MSLYFYVSFIPSSAYFPHSSSTSFFTYSSSFPPSFSSSFFTSSYYFSLFLNLLFLFYINTKPKSFSFKFVTLSNLIYHTSEPRIRSKSLTPPNQELYPNPLHTFLQTSKHKHKIRSIHNNFFLF